MDTDIPAVQETLFLSFFSFTFTTATTKTETDGLFDASMSTPRQ